MNAGLDDSVPAVWQGLPLTAGWIAAALLLVLLVYVVLLASGVRVRRRRGGRAENRSLRSTLTASLFLMTTLPMIALALVIVERSVDAQVRQQEARLSAAARGVANAADEILARHVGAVRGIARRIGERGTLDSDALGDSLAFGHRLYPDFLTMIVVGSDARVLAATQRVDGAITAARLAGATVGDRAYFQVPLATGEPFVSRVFEGRGFGNDPIVAVSAPYGHGTVRRFGIVEGSLDLGVFGGLRERFALGDTDLVIADDEGRVLYSTLPDRHPVLTTIDAARPFGTAGEQSERWLVTGATTAHGWLVATRSAMAPIIANARGDWLHAWAWVVAAILISSLLASVMASRVTRPLARLREAVESTDIDSIGQPAIQHNDAPREVSVLFEHLYAMRRRVSATYQRLQSALSAEGEAYDKLAAREAVIEEKSRQLERANATLRQISRTDTLTGLANRHALTEVVEIGWRTVARSGGTLAVIMIDIDFFKRFNDRYGHPSGDACLRRVADLLRGSAGRALDVVARYGGEEFVVILAGTDLDAAVEVAGRIRAAVEAAAFEHAGSPFGVVTVSAGVAAARPADGDRFEQTLEAADQALYLAKRTGRNRVNAADAGQSASGTF